jgi:hypothetical protein
MYITTQKGESEPTDSPLLLSQSRFSGLQFDTKTEDAISCIYSFGICNFFI